MKNNKKNLAIIGVIALIIIIGCAIFINFKIVFVKHQNIAYEQYRVEDLRQARIYNSTFADNEEKFKEKIKDFPEADQVIANALYEKKTEIDTIRQQIQEDKSEIDKLNEINGTDGYNAEKDIAEIDNRIKENEEKLENIRITLNEVIKDNSIPLEYQETITTNGIKSAADYMTSI